MDYTNQLSVKNELDNFDGSQKDITVLQELDEKKVINKMLIKGNHDKCHAIEKRQQGTGHKERMDHHMDQVQTRK